MKRGKRTRLTTEHINNALKVRNVEPIYGLSSAEPLLFSRLNNDGLYVLQDKLVSLDDVVNAKLPKIPIQISVHAHWLAVDGVQPNIPQNPPSSASNSGRRAEKPDSIPAVGATGIPATVKPLVKHVLSKELRVFYQTVLNVLKSVDEDGVNVYNASTLDELVRQLSSTAGIQELVPYIVQACGEFIATHMHQPLVVQVRLDMLSALLRNSRISCEPYLQQFLPIVLSLVIGRVSGPGSFACRISAANVLSFLCASYADIYPDMVPRVVKTLLGMLEKCISSHEQALSLARQKMKGAVESAQLPEHLTGAMFGCLQGLQALGPSVLELLLFPIIPLIWTWCEEESGSLSLAEHSFGLLQCRVSIIQCVGSYIRYAGLRSFSLPSWEKWPMLSEESSQPWIHCQLEGSERVIRSRGCTCGTQAITVTVQDEPPPKRSRKGGESTSSRSKRAVDSNLSAMEDYFEMQPATVGTVAGPTELRFVIHTQVPTSK